MIIQHGVVFDIPRVINRVAIRDLHQFLPGG